MTDYTHTLVVDRPVREVYEQWTRFETFPRFMEGVTQVEQLDATHTSWDVEIAGVERHFDATITEQRPDEVVAWTTTDGSVHGGRVMFRPVAEAGTEVTLAMQFDPEGFLEQAGAATGIVGARVRSDLERFKHFIESNDASASGWSGDPTRDPRTDPSRPSPDDLGPGGVII
jgi:uncharacterized membrane protein